MLCLSDHQTMAFKDQSTIPKATFIEIGVCFLFLKFLEKLHAVFVVNFTVSEWKP